MTSSHVTMGSASYSNYLRVRYLYLLTLLGHVQHIGMNQWLPQSKTAWSKYPNYKVQHQSTLIHTYSSSTYILGDRDFILSLIAFLKIQSKVLEIVTQNSCLSFK